MGNPAENFATPRLAAAALFVREDAVLLVHKTYGNGWDVPGGYVDHGESPAAALEREIREELGLDKTASRLLVHDWAPTDAEGDKILYIFDCGQISDQDEPTIRLQGDELDSAEWVKVAALDNYVIPRLELPNTGSVRHRLADTHARHHPARRPARTLLPSTRAPTAGMDPRVSRAKAFAGLPSLLRPMTQMTMLRHAARSPMRTMRPTSAAITDLFAELLPGSHARLGAFHAKTDSSLN
jgi:8-oxo-dGTP pyrophosphatase MutT (NUDIX family)